MPRALLFDMDGTLTQPMLDFAAIKAEMGIDSPIADAWMIGDRRYDIEAGIAAGVRTVWISHGRERFFDSQPWRSVRDLMGLRALLDER